VFRRRGVGSWLIAQAADWLELGDVTRLLGYADPAEPTESAFLTSAGFRILTTTLRGLTFEPPP
jgi:GNAT superfamily N-acetyltransferase